MSTLADLQRRNLEKMESTRPPAGAPPEDTPSNEVSIIPSKTPSKKRSKPASSETSFTPSNNASHDHTIDAVSDRVNDAAHDGVITPSSHPSYVHAREGVRAVTRGRVREKAAKTSAALGPGLKEALDAMIRERLMEQLLPENGKGPVTRLNVEMPEELHLRLKQHCVQSRRPIKAVINALIALYLDQEAA